MYKESLELLTFCNFVNTFQKLFKKTQMNQFEPQKLAKYKEKQ